MSLPGTHTSLWRLASPWTRALVVVLLLLITAALGYGLWRASHAPGPTETEQARQETDRHTQEADRSERAAESLLDSTEGHLARADSFLSPVHVPPPTSAEEALSNIRR